MTKPSKNELLEKLAPIQAKWLDRIMEYYNGSEIVLESELHAFTEEILETVQPNLGTEEELRLIDATITDWETTEETGWRETVELLKSIRLKLSGGKQ